MRFVPAVRRCCLAAVLLVGAQPAELAATPSEASAAIAGEYVHSARELIAGIRLNPDGTFLYGLTVGSLDEHGQGRWTAVGNRIDLVSDPRPVAPTIIAGPIETAPGQPFAMRVVAPNGSDVPGVELRIEFDTGEPLDSYMAGEPWSLPAEEQRAPRYVTFSMNAYRLRSERLALQAETGTVAIFTLLPNDFGVADLTGAQGEVEGDTLTLRRIEGVMKFRRIKD